jgi:NADPH:quinone reductase-like Zn-dependent oxidoreductase
MKLPKTTRALIVRQSSNQRTPPYHDAKLEEKSLPPLTVGQVLVQMRAVSFNRRDVGRLPKRFILTIESFPVQLWARLGKQPGMKFGATFGSDGVGLSADSLLWMFTKCLSS